MKKVLLLGLLGVTTLTNLGCKNRQQAGSDLREEGSRSSTTSILGLIYGSDKYRGAIRAIEGIMADVSKKKQYFSDLRNMKIYYVGGDIGLMKPMVEDGKRIRQLCPSLDYIKGSGTRGALVFGDGKTVAVVCRTERREPIAMIMAQDLYQPNARVYPELQLMKVLDQLINAVEFQSTQQFGRPDGLTSAYWNVELKQFYPDHGLLLVNRVGQIEVGLDLISHITNEQDALACTDGYGREYFLFSGGSQVVGGCRRKNSNELTDPVIFSPDEWTLKTIEFLELHMIRDI
jgi:hypothetical protein